MGIAGRIKILPLLSMLAISLSLAPAAPGMAADLSQDDAKRLLKDTATIASYLELKGESDYTGKPQNIIKAALFGCYDAKSAFAYAQEGRKEAGKPTQPGTTALFTVNGKAVTADQILRREDAPDAFKNLAESFTCFMTRDAVALAALRFTGHRVKEHSAPKGDEFFGDVLLNDKGYYVSIDGLGDAPTEAVLKKVVPQGDGFVLTGEVVEVMGDPEEHKKPGTFRLELTPGDVPGTWKRRYSEKGAAE
ncbi:MAG: hypothetical protein E7022_00560 [Desulfovibrio desulfuricans]|jgi:hypothetical protein|nr:hypothetical protein [Desulfovibrio desulfuricans]